MQESAFATRVQAQLAASRALLASAPPVKAQRGNALPALMVVLVVVLLATAIGVGVATAMHHGIGQLTDAVAHGAK